MRPFISILTPAYNAAPFLPELIAGVASQDYDRYEHVVIDDGSTDGTADLLAAAGSSHSHLRWYSRPNRGQYETQNELIHEAKGDVITFISADDLYASHRTLSLVAEAFRSPGLDVVFGRTPRLVMATEGAYVFDPDLPGRLARPFIRHVLCIQHCSLFVRADFVRRERLYFDPTYQMRGDWDWLIRMFQATDRTRHIPEPLSYWRLHPDQTSRNAILRGRRETARLCAAHQINPQLAACARLAANTYAQIIHAYRIARHRGFPALWRKAAGSVIRAIQAALRDLVRS